MNGLSAIHDTRRCVPGPENNMLMGCAVMIMVFRGQQVDRTDYHVFCDIADNA